MKFRKFVTAHPDYRHDSVIPDQVQRTPSSGEFNLFDFPYTFWYELTKCLRKIECNGKIESTGDA